MNVILSLNATLNTLHQRLAVDEHVHICVHSADNSDIWRWCGCPDVKGPCQALLHCGAELLCNLQLTWMGNESPACNRSLSAWADILAEWLRVQAMCYLQFVRRSLGFCVCRRPLAGRLKSRPLCTRGAALDATGKQQLRAAGRVGRQGNTSTCDICTIDIHMAFGPCSVPPR